MMIGLSLGAGDRRLPLRVAASRPVPVVERRAEPSGEQISRGVWKHTLTALRILQENRVVLGLMLFSWVYNTAGAMAGQFGQVYFPATGLTMVAAGFVFATARLLSAGGSALAERLGRSALFRTLRVAPLAQAMAFIGMGLGGGWAGAACYIAGKTLDGLISPSLLSRLSEAIPSEQRATLLSLESAGFSMLMVGAFPAAAVLQPVTHIYLVTGGVAALVGVIWAAFFRY